MTFLFTFCVTFAVQSTLCLPRLFFPRVCPFSSAYDFVNGYSFADVPLCVAGSRCPVRTDYMKLPLLCVDDVFAPPLRRGERSRPCITFACISYVVFRFVGVGFSSLCSSPHMLCRAYDAVQPVVAVAAVVCRAMCGDTRHHLCCSFCVITVYVSSCCRLFPADESSPCCTSHSSPFFVFASVCRLVATRRWFCYVAVGSQGHPLRR